MKAPTIAEVLTCVLASLSSASCVNSPDHAAALQRTQSALDTCTKESEQRRRTQDELQRTFDAHKVEMDRTTQRCEKLAAKAAFFDMVVPIDSTQPIDLETALRQFAAHFYSILGNDLKPKQILPIRVGEITFEGKPRVSDDTPLPEQPQNANLITESNDRLGRYLEAGLRAKLTSFGKIALDGQASGTLSGSYWPVSGETVVVRISYTVRSAVKLSASQMVTRASIGPYYGQFLDPLFRR